MALIDVYPIEVLGYTSAEVTHTISTVSVGCFLARNLKCFKWQHYKKEFELQRIVSAILYFELNIPKITLFVFQIKQHFQLADFLLNCKMVFNLQCRKFSLSPDLCNNIQPHCYYNVIYPKQHYVSLKILRSL